MTEGHEGTITAHCITIDQNKSEHCKLDHYTTVSNQMEGLFLMRPEL